MIWESWIDFFVMGGYGLYVWGSIIVVVICMLGELVALALRRKTILAQLSVVQRSTQRSGQRHSNQPQRVGNETAE